jgi:hypothetical protein
MHSLRENSRCNAARENGAHSAKWGGYLLQTPLRARSRWELSLRCPRGGFFLLKNAKCDAHSGYVNSTNLVGVVAALDGFADLVITM